MSPAARLKKAAPVLVALVGGGLLFNWKKFDLAPVTDLVKALPIWPEPPTEGQLNARLEIASDEMKRAEDTVRRARESLAQARGLQQHLFWNQQIDAFQAKALQKRERYEAAKKAREAFVDFNDTK